MAIQLEFLSFIVPIQTIEKKYRGGWAQCLADHKRSIGGRVWYDDHLFRDGTMNSFDMHCLVSRWKKMGFRTLSHRGDETRWVDVCVVDRFMGVTAPCGWIEVDDGIAYLKGTPQGDAISGETVATRYADEGSANR